MGLSRFKWFVGIGIVGALAWIAWEMVGLHVQEPGGVVAPAVAEAIIGAPIPAEAANVRVASYRQWIEHGQYVRFEAPVEVCLRYAKAVMPGSTLEPVDELSLKWAAEPARPDVFHDLSWFDTDKAKDVVSADGGSGQPTVWVDQVRGVFYYQKTD